MEVSASVIEANLGKNLFSDDYQCKGGAWADSGRGCTQHTVASGDLFNEKLAIHAAKCCEIMGQGHIHE